MKQADLYRLERLDELVQLPSGRRGVRVALQYRGQVPPYSTLQAREGFLTQRFKSLARSPVLGDAQVHLDSLSTSGQTVEASLPVEDYDSIVNGLKDHDIDVVVLEKHTLT